MRIPIPQMLRAWRHKLFKSKKTTKVSRICIKIWALLATNPYLYNRLARILIAFFCLAGQKKGRISWLPLGNNWTLNKDFPLPQGGTFLSQYYKKRMKGK